MGYTHHDLRGGGGVVGVPWWLHSNQRLETGSGYYDLLLEILPILLIYCYAFTSINVIIITLTMTWVEAGVLLGSPDSLPQEHLTGWPLMSLLCMETMACVALSLVANLFRNDIKQNLLRIKDIKVRFVFNIQSVILVSLFY